jgi:ribosomal-protein-alanine N-acetyltransferase
MTVDQRTFLVGPELYLRPIEPSDAESAPIWNGSAMPRPPEVERSLLEDRLGGDIWADIGNQRLLILRRDTDRPVGALTCKTGRFCQLLFHFDPRASYDDWARVCSETLRLMVPWQLHERSRKQVYVMFPGEHPLVEQTASELEMRRCMRVRERIPYRGTRLDAVGYEALHPGWVEKLGYPRGMEEGPDMRVVANPAPLQWHPAFEPPDSAMLVGNRLYLRAFTPEDADLAARQLLGETEHSFPEGRDLLNPYVSAQSVRENARQPLPREHRFAMVLGESDEMIGANALVLSDPFMGVAETETEIWTADNRSKGYGTEAKHLLLEYAFERLGLHMVYSWVSEFNTRSAAALRKQGYRDAGYIAWGDYHGTELFGGLHFDLLASEWRASRR